MRKLFLLLGFTAGLAGCATLGVRDSSLELKIVPQPVYRGKPALAEINAPLDALSVVGTVEVMGSPELIFRKDDKKREWYFYGAIP
ncbi:MAG: lipoprotein, partial [bacterium]